MHCIIDIERSSEGYEQNVAVGVLGVLRISQKMHKNSNRSYFHSFKEKTIDFDTPLV